MTRQVDLRGAPFLAVVFFESERGKSCWGYCLSDRSCSTGAPALPRAPLAQPGLSVNQRDPDQAGRRHALLQRVRSQGGAWHPDPAAVQTDKGRASLAHPIDPPRLHPVAEHHQAARHRQMSLHTGGSNDLERGTHRRVVGNHAGGILGVGLVWHHQRNQHGHQPLPVSSRRFLLRRYRRPAAAGRPGTALSRLGWLC